VRPRQSCSWSTKRCFFHRDTNAARGFLRGAIGKCGDALYFGVDTTRVPRALDAVFSGVPAFAQIHSAGESRQFLKIQIAEPVGLQGRDPSQRLEQLNGTNIDLEPSPFSTEIGADFGDSRRERIPIGARNSSQTKRSRLGQAFQRFRYGRGPYRRHRCRPPSGNSRIQTGVIEFLARTRRTAAAARVTLGGLPSPGRRR